MQEDKLEKDCVYLLKSVWKNIDFQNMPKRRRMNIYNEFANKVRSATLTSNLQKFIEQLSKKMGVKLITDKRILDIIRNNDHSQMLDLLRTETTYLILLMREQIESGGGKSE